MKLTVTPEPGGARFTPAQTKRGYGALRTLIARDGLKIAAAGVQSKQYHCHFVVT